VQIEILKEETEELRHWFKATTWQLAAAPRNGQMTRSRVSERQAAANLGFSICRPCPFMVHKERLLSMYQHLCESCQQIWSDGKSNRLCHHVLKEPNVVADKREEGTASLSNERIKKVFWPQGYNVQL
jgi:hypothetical protein